MAYPPVWMVSPGEGLLTSIVIVAALGATPVVVIAGVVVVVVVGGAVVVTVVGLVAAGVLVTPPVLPLIHVSLAVAPTSPTLVGSSPIATGTEITLCAPLTLE